MVECGVVDRVACAVGSLEGEGFTVKRIYEFCEKGKCSGDVIRFIIIRGKSSVNVEHDKLPLVVDDLLEFGI